MNFTEQNLRFSYLNSKRLNSCHKPENLSFKENIEVWKKIHLNKNDI